MPESQSNCGEIDSQKAIEIVTPDAKRVYRDLSIYNVNAVLKEDGWHIDFELKDKHAQGGGPHYIVECKTGKIISKKYQQ